MIGQRHRGVADFGGEHLDQGGGDRPVDHGHIEHQQEQDADHQRLVDQGAVGLGGVSGLAQGDGQAGVPGHLLSVEVGLGHRLAVEGLHHAIADADLGHGSGGRGFIDVGDAGLGQVGLGQVARAVEDGLAHRVELEVTIGRIGDDRDRRRGRGGGQARVGRLGQGAEQREIGQRRQQAAGEDDRLAADLVRQPAEDDEEGRRQGQGGGDQDVGQGRIDPQRLLQEEQGVELARVPDHGLTGGQAEQGDQDDLQVGPLQEAVLQRRGRALALGFHALERRAFGQLQADPQRHAQQQDRDQEGNAPAPCGEGFLAHRVADAQDDGQAEHQARRRRDLDEGGVEAALAVRGVLGDVGGGAAVFTAQRQTLDQAHQHQDDRRGDADGRIGRQEADHEGRQTHQQHGDEEGVLASPQVAQPPEDDGAERTDREPGGEGHQGEDIAGGLVHAREELGGDDRGQRAVEIEVVPFDDGADGGGENHQPVVLVDRVLHAPRRIHGAVGHGQSLPVRPRCAARFPRAPRALRRASERRVTAGNAVCAERPWSNNPSQEPSPGGRGLELRRAEGDPLSERVRGQSGRAVSERPDVSRLAKAECF
ncbi:hypothetical protein D3C80_922960 [compost metagenome]